MKKIISSIMIFMSIILLVACSNSSIKDVYEKNINENIGHTQYPLKITDKFGHEITIDSEPESIISFSPEFTEIIFAIGAGEKLFGRSTYCDFPEEAMEVEIIGDLFNYNIETLIEKEPDIVLLSSMASEETYNTITNQGLTVIILDADESFEGTYSYIENIGLILNRSDEASQLIENMKNRFNEVVESVENLEKPLVYFVTGCGEYGDSAATGDTFIGQMIEIAGGNNAAYDGTNWMYSIEALVEKDPDILICSKYWETKEQIMSLEGYKDLTAVKEGRLYEVDENIFYRQGPRIIDALEVLVSIIHHEANSN